jgi:hypothetical protein
MVETTTPRIWCSVTVLVGDLVTEKFETPIKVWLKQQDFPTFPLIVYVILMLHCYSRMGIP